MFNIGMSVKLIKLTKEYKNQLIEMIDEWKLDQEQNNTDRSPYAIFKNSYEDFDYYLENLASDNPTNGWVPNSVFFLYSDTKDKLLGAVDIRHELNDKLLKTGGHIGDGIRPSERGLGYGKLILELALEKCIELGINKVLVCCNKNNIRSRSSIIANGGELENTVIDEDGETIERYWIDAPKELLLKHVDEIHIDEIVLEKIKKNLGFFENELLSEIEDALTLYRNYSKVTRKDEEYYVEHHNVLYVIDANDYSVKSAKMVK